MKRFLWKRTISLLAVVCLLLCCAACAKGGGSAAVGRGGTVDAASMWLVKTEGTVAVTDGEGTDVPLLERLGLFSGYGVATRAASYGWIDLDETKFTKMDENSDVEIQKDGKNLTLTVNSGSLFFNITRSLAEDETLEIRSSTMVTAIRGTCGWVEVSDPDHMNVYILEGTVECSVGSTAESVAAGETAALSRAKGEEPVVKGTFGKKDVPGFVLAEVGSDSAMFGGIPEDAEPSVLEGPGGDYTISGPVLYTVPAASLKELGWFITDGPEEVWVVPSSTVVTAPDGVILGDLSTDEMISDNGEYFVQPDGKGGINKNEYRMDGSGGLWTFDCVDETTGARVGTITFLVLDTERDPALASFVASLGAPVGETGNPG